MHGSAKQTKKKFRKKQEKTILECMPGLRLEEPQMNQGSRLLQCLLHGLLLTALSFGMIDSFLSSFSIAYYRLPLFFCDLLIALYFSYLYSSGKRLVMDFGYLFYFAVFAASAFSLRPYANSGFSAMLNIVLKTAEQFFDLSGVRQYDTIVSDSVLTITVAAMFVSMSLVILCNIAVHSRFCLLWMLGMGGVILTVPFYMKQTPSFFSLFVLGFGLVLLLLYRSNRERRVFSNRTHFLFFPKKNELRYTKDSSVFTQLSLQTALFLFLLLSLLFALLPAVRVDSLFPGDPFRESTKETMAGFLQFGIDGFRNRYRATGGVNGGKLGGISSVRPDYETDLVVTYTPYNTDNVYLKAYTGGRYTGDAWLSLYDTVEQSASDIFRSDTMHAEMKQLLSAFQENTSDSASGLMKVENVGADIHYLYYPYYTNLGDEQFYDTYQPDQPLPGIGYRRQAAYTYYPVVDWKDSLWNIPASSDTAASPDALYLEVPTENQAVLQQLCSDMGLTSEQSIADIFHTMQNYFAKNYTYTLRPGITPESDDFVNYFLTENKKGYCTHFASAATLLFRQMGIPARYVEGYSFSLENVLASEAQKDEQYADYYQGFSALGESAVMNVEVTDAMAHAWVEIYIDNFGWKPVDLTPSDDDSSDVTDFWSAFSDFTDSADIDTSTTTQTAISQFAETSSHWILYGFGAACVFYLLFFLARFTIRTFRRYRRYHASDPSAAVLARYQDICDVLRRRDNTFARCRCHREQVCYLQKRFPGLEIPDELAKWLEEISYGSAGNEAAPYAEMTQILKKVRRQLFRYFGEHRR